MIFNPAVPYEVPHMILAAYLVTGFLVASVYAVGMLRGRRDRYHRLGLLIPLTVALHRDADPVRGRRHARRARSPTTSRSSSRRWSACRRPRRDVTEYIYGRCTRDGVKGGIGIPGFDSFLVGWSTSTQVTGLDTVPPDDRPPANTMLHWAFDTMVGICSVLIALGPLARRSPGGESATSRSTPWFLRAVAVSGVAAVVALECGWIVTEVGRQPWVVYDVMRTKDAVTGASGIWVTFAIVFVLYAVLGAATVITLRTMARRWREADADDEATCPTGPSGEPPPALVGRGRREHRGCGRRRPVGRRDASTRSSAAPTSARASGACSPAAASAASAPRELIDWAIGPVWEANHVWLIFVLVVLWTAFSSAFGSIFSTLFIPLSLAALGIVLRGSGFAFQRTARERTGPRHVAERALRRSRRC